MAAKLSRGLERPRIETEGRFARAIHLAEKHGSYRQRLDSHYEQIWTAFWWFDDFEFLNSSYDSFGSLALQSDHAKNLELLGNLLQLLFNSVLHGHMTAEECQLDARTATLSEALSKIADNPDRPNNSLEAQAALLRIQLNKAMIAGDREALPSVWRGLSVVIEKAEGLGEFDADSLVSFIEVAGQVAGNDAAYNELVERLAEFVGDRKNEAEGALILLSRAKKLSFEAHFDMIRWLGKAAVGLTKREYSESLIDAVQLLMLAYRSAGLDWAARASCVLCTASLIIEGEESSELPVGVVPTMNVWAWNALERSHLPDFLLAVQFLNGFFAGLPLAEESKTRLGETLLELDLVAGCLFLNLQESELRGLEEVPDILEALGLSQARVSLLYALGYEDVLREDGSIPIEETDENVRQLLTTLKSQPAADSPRAPLILNQDDHQILQTTILGMRVDVEIDGIESVPIAECILASLEVFFATALEQRVAPHTEVFHVKLAQSDQVRKPVIETNEIDMTTTITWPQEYPFTRYDRQRDVCDFLTEVAAHIMGAGLMVKDAEAVLDRLFGDDAVQHRVMMVSASPNSYSRVTSRDFSRLSDWQKLVRRTYPLRDQRIDLPRIKLNDPADDNVTGTDPFEVKSHKGMSVRSVIDVHAWNHARWRGCGYLSLSPAQPPFMVLLFEDADAARKIFERWQERFGNDDVNEEIAISIIRELPEANIHHYCVQIAPKTPSSSEAPKVPTLFATRSMTMEPISSQNLEVFLSEYERHGCYALLPGVGIGNPEFCFGLSIMKRNLTVKAASEVSEHDPESIALHMRGFKCDS